MHRDGWLLLCMSLHRPLVLSSLSITNTIKCRRMLLKYRTHPSPPPLNAVSIVDRCHSCHPLPQSNANAHLHPSPLSNADARHRHLPPLMSISIVASSSPILSPHHRRRRTLPPPLNAPPPSATIERRLHRPPPINRAMVLVVGRMLKRKCDHAERVGVGEDAYPSFRWVE